VRRAAMRPIAGSNPAYEKWLRGRLTLVSDHPRREHEKMAKSAFAFLRASFFRWVEMWPHVCSDIARAPRILCVGGIHVENV
jgi:uncharacterized protein (DUF2252 family)